LRASNANYQGGDGNDDEPVFLYSYPRKAKIACSIIMINQRFRLGTEYYRLVFELDPNVLTVFQLVVLGVSNVDLVMGTHGSEFFIGRLEERRNGIANCTDCRLFVDRFSGRYADTGDSANAANN
jgi:hypothetical protein